MIEKLVGHLRHVKSCVMAIFQGNATPPRIEIKVFLRIMVVNTPLIRPYFLEGVPFRGAPLDFCAV